MRKISERIWTYLPGSNYLTMQDIQSVAQREGMLVHDYADIVKKIASLERHGGRILNINYWQDYLSWIKGKDM